MKKKVLFVASLFLATATFAQDGLTSKKGEAYLPEAGDWVVGFDGTPFLNYGGNLFNGTQDNTLNANWQDNANTLVGKFYKDANTEYRVKLIIGYSSDSNKDLIDINPNNFGEPQYIENVQKVSELNFALGAGLEKRKGNTRIQGLYGAEGMIMIGRDFFKEDFGLALSDANPGSRVTQQKSGTGITFSVRAFVGVEYFVAPKVSVSAEYGWGLAYKHVGDAKTTTEVWGPADENATENTSNNLITKTGGNSSFGIDTDNNGGSISILFHF
jgi:hypothetical protein